MYVLIVALLVLGVASAAPAQIQVDIGIHLPAPPQLVIVPEVRTVRYVPAGSANLFFYNGQYWAFASGGWHVSVGYNGPWIVVAPQYVPRPVLLVPVRYYRVPPGHWKQWRADRAPRWADEWGREWAAKRDWKGEGPRDHDGPGRGKARGHDQDGPGRDKGQGRGHGRGR